MNKDFTTIEEATKEFCLKVEEMRKNTQNVLMSDTIWANIEQQLNKSKEMLTETITLLDI